MNAFGFPPPPSSPEAEALRGEVRTFLKIALADRKPVEKAESWTGTDAAFSRQMGQRGWIGMTWPKQHGGHERSALERYVVLEEMLAAGAPVALHWIADRQSGPLILRVGTDEQKKVLPRIAAGEAFFCIGMSEPDVGSDLASVRTRAAKVQGGYLVNGTKVWTSFAHLSHYMILFCRTGQARDAAADRHGGVSQFLVDLHDTPRHHHPPDPRADRRAPFQRSRLPGRLPARHRPARPRGRRLEPGHQRTGVRAQRSGAVPVVVHRCSSNWSARSAAIRATRRDRDRAADRAHHDAAAAVPLGRRACCRPATIRPCRRRW